MLELNLDFKGPCIQTILSLHLDLNLRISDSIVDTGDYRETQVQS